MKRLLYLLLSALFIGACSEQDETTLPTGEEAQRITCTLISPQNHASHYALDPLTIEGEVEVNYGSLTEVKLQVNNQPVEAVSTTPFSVEYTPSESDIKRGTLTLLLTAKGDQGASGMSSCTVSLTTEAPKPETPRPEGVDAVVAQDGSGDYASVQAAIQAQPQGKERWVILIKPGTYYEKITVNSQNANLVLLGEEAETTILTYDDYAGKAVEGGTMGTQNSASFTLKAKNFTAVNLTFQNSYVNYASLGSSGTQAVALRGSGDCAAFYGCRFIGYQDTLYLKDGSRCYLKGCYIEGNVDFIFGDSVALFEECQLHCNREESVLTAASTRAESLYGFVFDRCTITHAEGNDFNGKPITRIYLGRTWQNAPRTVFLRCEEPAAIIPRGWNYMSSSSPIEPALYAEYQCTGAGAEADRLAQRQIGRQLTEEEAAAYTRAVIFSAQTNPSLYGQDWLPEEEFSL